MAARFDRAALIESLLRELRRRGPASGSDIARGLGISQATFSRAAVLVRDRLAVVGRGRSLRYAALRSVPETPSSLPLYEIDETGGARRLATVHTLDPRGFLVDPSVPDGPTGLYEDVPYFLNELRPAGFLGRLIPARHPDLDVPRDIGHWTSDHTIEYLARYGWDMPGALILGDAAFQMHLAAAAARRDAVDRRQRARKYPRMAEDVLAVGPPGSSAAGEQPKFLAWRDPGPVAVLVKFSPPAVDATSRRIADLLVAEHVALETLSACGHDACRSEIVRAGGRVFLEVERFDRLGCRGRRGVISLFALDAEFVGRLEGWSETAEELRRQGRLAATIAAEIRWRERFGHLIGNSDMHAGNVSLFTRGSRVVGLAPVYDMTSMAYYPKYGHLRRPALAPVTPGPADSAIWSSACDAAALFWRTLARRRDIAGDLGAIGRDNERAVEAARSLAALLPAR